MVFLSIRYFSARTFAAIPRFGRYSSGSGRPLWQLTTIRTLPFEDLARTLERERNLKRTSLCQVMFILQNTMPQPLTFPGLTLRLLATEEGVGEPDLTLTTFDVILVLERARKG